TSEQTNIEQNTQSSLGHLAPEPNDKSTILKSTIIFEDELSISDSSKISPIKPTTFSAQYLINKEQFKLISKWIHEISKRSIISKLLFPNATVPPYEFKLLLRGSRDGFTPADFHKMCDGKGATLTVLRVKHENEILGGYNPHSWDSPISSKYCNTSKSFIFKFDYNNPE
ncbi:14398_t:CDS:2, partial [Gigaspora rosea]